MDDTDRSAKRREKMVCPVVDVNPELDDIPGWRQRFERAEQSFVEYHRSGGLQWGTLDRPYVLGAFGAYANPSSFHNRVVRHLRYRAHQRLHPVFRRVWECHKRDVSQLHVEQLIDRMMRRFRSFRGESWHRDVANPKRFGDNLRDTDLIFGGWINLDETDQTFTVAPGTHVDEGGNLIQGEKAGFAVENQQAPDNRTDVAVPPGHILCCTWWHRPRWIRSVCSRDSGARTTILGVLGTRGNARQRQKKLLQHPD